MNFDLVKTIFEQAIDLPPEAREQFLLDQSSGDQDIIAEVHSLLSCTSDEDDDEETLDPIIGIFAGPWLIETRIGGGGMGRVYSATDPKTNKQAAVKVLRRVLIDRNAAKRFEQEIRVLGRINHDGVARIKGAGTLELDGDRAPWVAMELVVGAVPITTFAKNKPLEIKLQLLRDVCRAVGEAHKQGVIHRDLKPSNILVNKNGEVKIIDFGIAKVIDDTIRPTGLHTQTGALLGTLQYMPPENELKTTCDVYSLGVIMYEMLAGQRPYELRGDSLQALMHAIATTDPTPIAQVFPVYKGPIASVVHKALTKSPSNRYATANEFAEDLQHLIDGTPVGARAEPFFVRLVRKHRTTSAVLAFTIPVLIAATAISIYFAIDANHQLVRNEKLLLFAKDALTVQREILEQHTGYWKVHSSLVKARADELTEGEVLLRVQMYELLGGQSNTQRISPEIYKEAYQLASGQVGKNHPIALILEAKHIATGGVRDENGDRDAETSVRRMQALLERWQGGSPEQHAELLYQVAWLELESPKAEVRKVGHEHAIHSEEIARTFYIEGEDQKPVVQPIGRRVWSLIFQEGDAISLTKAIALLNEQALPILQKKYDPADIRILKTMAYLAIAHLQRSYHKNGAEQLKDIEEALRVNEFVVAEIVKQCGDGYNIAWQVMNNLAMSLSAKARWLETNNVNQTLQEGTNQNPEMLKQRAASIWWRIMQQVHFKAPADPSPHEWYLDTFQAEIPELAPSDEEHAEWQKKMDWLP